jgi:hypothetical protein
MKDRHGKGETRRGGDKFLKLHLDFRSLIPEILNPDFDFFQARY